VSTDPLYKLGGRLFQNISVVPPKSKALPLGTIGKLYDTYQGHALSNFEGSGRAVGGMLRVDVAAPVEHRTKMTRAEVDAIKRRIEAVDTEASFAEQYAAIKSILDDLKSEDFLNSSDEMEIGLLKGNIEGAMRKPKGSSKPNEFLNVLDKVFGDRLQGRGKKVGNKVVMPIGEFKAEHKRLVKALTPAAKELKAQQKEMKMYGGGFFDALFERDPEKRKKIQEERAQKLTRAITGPKLGIFGYGKPPMKLVTASGKVHRGAYHMMADGSVHSGKTHTKRSMPLFVKE
jgi:hypothetical protein